MRTVVSLGAAAGIGTALAAGCSNDNRTEGTAKPPVPQAPPAPAVWPAAK